MGGSLERSPVGGQTDREAEVFAVRLIDRRD